MRVLAIDQASEKSGYAFGDTTSGLTSVGLIHVKPSRFSDLGSRFFDFEKKLKALLAEHKPECVCFEEHRCHSGVQAAQVLGAITGIVMKVAKEAGCSYRGAPVSSHKKALTGCARASKELTTAVARKRWPGLVIVDDNVADAVSIWTWARKEIED